MNAKSILTRSDYEDFIVLLYFGSGQDHLIRCINRAYLDFSRTLHGLNKLKSKSSLYEKAQNNLRQVFADVQNGQAHVTDQVKFDQWHQAACQRISAIYKEYDHELFVGQAQKWLNMTFKYIFTLGENRLPGFGEIYQFCHVPLDNILINQLTKYGFPPLPCRWSRLNNYDEYLSYQLWIRRRFVLVPLDIEFKLWLGKDVDATPTI